MEQKISTVPPLLIDYLRKDNLNQGFPNRPVAAQLSPSLKDDLVAAIRELPESTRTLVNSKLYGIFIVNDLGGSAYTDTVLSDKNEPVGAFLVLDAAALDKRANEWISWKENSPFIPEAKYEILAEIEEPSSNNRKNALQFILLHEFGHVVAATRDLHPSWSEAPAAPDRYPFSAISWTLDENHRYKTPYDENFKLRSRVQYYRGPETKLAISSATQIYSDLEKTAFVTLYAATSPFDDFADSFATYVHTVQMGRPYLVRLLKGSKFIKTFSPCWGQPRCEGKRALIERIVNGG